ncbi:MAG: hypothetical protein ABI369_10385 [Acetobacteraceae bacterium]
MAQGPRGTIRALSWLSRGGGRRAALGLPRRVGWGEPRPSVGGATAQAQLGGEQRGRPGSELFVEPLGAPLWSALRSRVFSVAGLLLR